MRAFAPPLLALLLCCATSCSRPSGTNESRTAEAKVALRNLGEAMQQATAELNEGWVTLLDGTSLFGWKANSDLNWTNNGGELSADAGQPGLLLTTFQLADYELMCEYRLAKGGNSGIFLRTPMEPKDPTRDCYEFNLCDSHPAFPTGSLVGRKKNEAPAAGEDVWKKVHLIVEGNRIRATIDGQPVIDFTDDSPDRLTRGHIGLQMNGGRIEFRNVKLKPLGTAPVFNGSDLSGWRIVPGSKSEFEVADGAIHVTGGPGFLETEQTWDDFVLQAEARTNGDGLNSGIFFRAETGTAEAPSNGYEMQIHNGYKNNDPTQPVDAGTGAIFRRNQARIIVAKDREWFHATLIADGPHVSVWINGHQVTDWTDDREPHANPRKGQRLEAGHLSLQGHDKTTDLNFRNLRVGSIPR